MGKRGIRPHRAFLRCMKASCLTAGPNKLRRDRGRLTPPFFCFGNLNQRKQTRRKAIVKLCTRKTGKLTTYVVVSSSSSSSLDTGRGRRRFPPVPVDVPGRGWLECRGECWPLRTEDPKVKEVPSSHATFCRRGLPGRRVDCWRRPPEPEAPEFTSPKHSTLGCR